MRMLWLAATITALATPLARCQSNEVFTNFETPQVKPITHASLPWSSGGASGTLDVVFVCNTPANFVEVYDATTLALRGRVKVGLGPATVRWVPTLNLLYTCNLDGDSVSVVQVLASGPGQVGLRLVRTTHVGDEPADIAISPDLSRVFVTLSGRSSVAVLNPITLAPISPAVPESVLECPPHPIAVKQPRQIQFGPGGQLYVLNHMGNVSSPTASYDLDVWFLNNPTTVSQVFTGGQVQGLGSTNHAFALTSDGSRMVVVGTLAQARNTFGESALRALQFGFVESWMWVVDTSSSVPTVAAEAPAVTIPAPLLPSINLNRNYGAGIPAVSPPDALAQPTDVVVVESAPGLIDYIAVAAFHSDRIAVLRPNTAVAGGYDIARLDLAALSDHKVCGPRGLTVHPATGKLYVACRLDNSLRMVDIVTMTQSASTPLAADPTPDIIRSGRELLYSARRSGNGFVSCASCHIDGRTDALPWDLSDPAPGLTVPSNLLGASDTIQVFSGAPFPANKGVLVTQTLQGLANDLVNEEAQLLFSNAPYHWRGDRPDFQAFSVAFPNLLGGTDPGKDAMNLFATFINTIRHPPNPEQDLTRTVPGTLTVGPGGGVTATGIKDGLANYHNVIPDHHGLSCVDCHALPEGSDSKITCALQGMTGSGATSTQPFETAQLRNLFPREFQITRGSQAWFVSSDGISHGGRNPLTQGTIDLFVDNIFSFPEGIDETAIAAYVRGLDWGMAPAATYAYTLVGSDSPGNTSQLALLEGQVKEGNAGLAVTVRIGTGYVGLWYDLTSGTGVYRDIVSGATHSSSFVEALSRVPDATVVLQGTPPGDERRYASASGTFVPPTISPPPPKPSNIAVLPMAPMTYHTDIPSLSGAMHLLPGNTLDPALSPATNVWSLRTLQLGLLGQFGVSTTPHHEPPRRWRVTGDNLRVGAKLIMAFPTAIELELHPTDRMVAGRVVWESEEELAPLAQFLFLAGAPTGSNLYAFRVENENGDSSLAVFAPLTIQDTR